TTHGIEAVRTMSDWFRLHIAKFIGGISGLSACERGVYVSLLVGMYEVEGPLQRNDSALDRRCGCPEKMLTPILNSLIKMGKITCEGGMLFNERTRNEIEWLNSKSIVAKNRANRRWEKSKENQSQVSADAMLIDADSDSDSTRVSSLRSESLVGAPRRKQTSRRSQISEDAQPTDADRRAAADAGLDAATFRRE